MKLALYIYSIYVATNLSQCWVKYISHITAIKMYNKISRLISYINKFIYQMNEAKNDYKIVLMKLH